ncbi:hypothetical protein BJV82DRAFT_612774 [Fennellomyces sp. T-0311]|nr:hypothetical protein BJV82DRAFT_612774 [Fennellomyces sp. T-0311]
MLCHHYMHSELALNEKRVERASSFDPFMHASSMMHQQSDFWHVFSGALARALNTILATLPQDPRAKTPSTILIAEKRPLFRERHRHQCWQPVDEKPCKAENTSLPSWMFTHKHARDIRSNPDALRKLSLKVEMVRHKKLSVSRIKSEHKRYLPSRADAFIPARKSPLSQQL